MVLVVLPARRKKWEGWADAPYVDEGLGSGEWGEDVIEDGAEAEELEDMEMESWD